MQHYKQKVTVMKYGRVLLAFRLPTIDLLHTIFPQFTLSELQSTDNFEAGEMLLALSSGNNKVHCRRIATDCDLLYVGNSQDRQEIIYKIFNRMYLMNWNAEELALRISENEKSRNHFVDTFTIEILNYFGFSSEDSKYLHTLIHRLVQNLTTDFVTKQLTS